MKKPIKKRIKHGTRFYVDASGNQLGGFGDGAEPKDANAIRVMKPPSSGHDTWDAAAQIWKPRVKTSAEVEEEIDRETDDERTKGERADRTLLFRLMKAASNDPANYTRADFRKTRRALIAKMK